MSGRRAGTTAVLVLLAVTLGALLTGWAASIGPAGVLDGDGLEPDRASQTPTATATPQAGAGDVTDELRDQPRETRPWVGQVLLGLLVAGAAVLLVLTVAAVVRAVRRRDRGADDASPPAGAGELLATRSVAAELRADAAEQQRVLLDTGAPRDAIVACWQRFESTAARAGTARRVWETPAEYVGRVLQTVGADPDATGRLAELYREARFSTHPMTEAHRSAAATELATVHASLGRVVT